MSSILTSRSPSLAIRQSLLIMALSLVAIFVCAFVLIAFARADMHADALRTVDTDMAGLVDGMAAGGAPEIEQRIIDRIALDPRDGEAPLYFLAGADGRKLAGNLPAMPALDAAHSTAGEVPVGDGQALMRATRLSGGLTLVVGRSLGPAQRLTMRLWRVFTWTALAVALGSLVVGRLAAERIRRRLTSLNDTFERFDRGDVAARAGRTGGDDEIGQLALYVDEHLERIQSLMSSQRQISDNIAHELRTPLMHLDNRLMRALDQAPSPAVAVEIDAARTDIRMVISLFDGLLDIALAEAAAPAPSAIADLSEVTADVAELYAASAEEAGIELVVRIAPGVTLRGEAMQLARMIANLLDNALKYAPAGSRVRVEVAAGPRLVVEDNGPGVPEADRERIFQRFLRSRESTNGHGLGLAFVRVIAMRHGLSARVEDAKPGARFIIEPAA
jgi:signal transduction histidine kinase